MLVTVHYTASTRMYHVPATGGVRSATRVAGSSSLICQLGTVLQHRHFRPTRSQARGIWTHRSDRSDRSARRRTSGASLAPEKADASGSGATTAPVPEEDVWRWSTTSDAVITYGVFLGVLALGTVPQVQSMSQSGLFYFISLAVGIDLDRRALALRSSLFALRSSLALTSRLSYSRHAHRSFLVRQASSSSSV